MDYRKQIFSVVDSRMPILEKVAEIKHICFIFWYSPLFILESKVVYFESLYDYHSFIADEMERMRNNDIKTFCILLDGQYEYATDEFNKLLDNK